MTPKELLKGYMAYIRKIPSIAGSVSNYSPAIKNLPFDYIEIVMSKWEVKEKNGIYEEQIIGHSASKQSCDKRTYCLWRYFKVNIEPVVSVGNHFDYLKTISDFIDHNDIVYALSVIDIISGIAELANRYKNEYNSQMRKSGLPGNQIVFTNSTKADYFSKCRKALKLMLEWVELNKSFIQNVISCIIPGLNLDSIRKNIVKPLIYKIDGAKALAKEIGVDNFIQYAIDQCYFFEPYIVMQRMSEIVTDYTKGFNLYARKSENTSIQIPDGDSNTNSTRRNTLNIERASRGLSTIKNILDKPLQFAKFNDVAPYAATNYPIVKDGDGNRALRDVIKDYTGYTVSEGKESIFQNYRLSHIWGRAYDPRFFTNLWNVVLVPAWANDLLDKPNPVEGSLESKLKSTIQRICEVLYFGGITNWSSINISQPDVINRDKNGNDDRVWPKTVLKAVKPKDTINNDNTTGNKNAPKNPLPYLINIIKDKGSKTLGDIVKYPVYI